MSIAWRLAQAGRRVQLVCNADRLGGVIASTRDGEWLLENGPNSYASFGADEEQFLDQLGLRERALRRSLRTTDRYIFHSRRLHRVPTGPLSFLTSPILPPAARLRILRGVVGRYQPPAHDIAIGAFFRQVLGDPAVDTLLKPALAGIYAADADRIGLEGAFPKLARALAENNRLIPALKSMRGPSPAGAKRTPRSLTTFPEGLEELPRALEQALRGADVPLHTGAQPRLQPGTERRWRVEWQDGTAEADHVVLAVPPPAAAELLAPVCPQARQPLAAIEGAALTVAHVGIRAEDMPGDWNGFGFLVRRGEPVRMLGAIWSSSIFAGRAPRGHYLLTCFYGGDIDPEVTEWPDSRLAQQVQADLAATMGWQGDAFALLRFRHWRPALPLYRVGHAGRVRSVESALPEGLHLAGNWLGGISIPDCIRRGWEVADRIDAALPRET